MAMTYKMDLLGNFTSGAGGIKLNNSANASITHAVNAPIAITTLDRPNPSTVSANIDDAGDDLVMDEDFGATTCTVAHDDAGNLIDP